MSQEELYLSEREARGHDPSHSVARVPVRF